MVQNFIKKYKEKLTVVQPETMQHYHVGESEQRQTFKLCHAITLLRALFTIVNALTAGWLCMNVTLYWTASFGIISPPKSPKTQTYAKCVNLSKDDMYA